MAAQLIYNARIFTSATGDESIYQAVVTAGDHIAFVGSEEGARAHIREVN
jgi:predicted amidohydrolase YtcJ